MDETLNIGNVANREQTEINEKINEESSKFNI